MPAAKMSHVSNLVLWKTPLWASLYDQKFWELVADCDWVSINIETVLFVEYHKVWILSLLEPNSCSEFSEMQFPSLPNSVLFSIRFPHQNLKELTYSLEGDAHVFLRTDAISPGQTTRDVVFQTIVCPTKLAVRSSWRRKRLLDLRADSCVLLHTIFFRCSAVLVQAELFSCAFLLKTMSSYSK